MPKPPSPGARLDGGCASVVSSAARPQLGRYDRPAPARGHPGRPIYGLRLRGARRGQQGWGAEAEPGRRNASASSSRSSHGRLSHGHMYRQCAKKCADLGADMCTDMCIDMCEDMCIDMCTDISSSRSPHAHLCVYVCVCVCLCLCVCVFVCRSV